MDSLFRKEYLDYQHGEKVIEPLLPVTLSRTWIILTLFVLIGLVTWSLQLTYTESATSAIVYDNGHYQLHVKNIDHSSIKTLKLRSQGIEPIMFRTQELQIGHNCYEDHCLVLDSKILQAVLQEKVNFTQPLTVLVEIERRYFQLD